MDLHGALSHLKALAPDHQIILRREVWYKPCVDRTEETYKLYVFSHGAKGKVFADSTLDSVVSKFEQEAD